jgi:hypothetical protein
MLTSRVVAVTSPDDVFRRLKNWFVGRIWKGLEKWARKGLGGYKQSLWCELKTRV